MRLSMPCQIFVNVVSVEVGFIVLQGIRQKKYCVWICGQRLYCKDACKCEMRILKEQQLQEYVIEALKGSGMPVEDGYSDKIVRKYIKKVVIYEEYILVDIFD